MVVSEMYTVSEDENSPDWSDKGKGLPGKITEQLWKGGSAGSCVMPSERRGEIDENERETWKR